MIIKSPEDFLPGFFVVCCLIVRHILFCEQISSVDNTLRITHIQPNILQNVLVKTKINIGSNIASQVIQKSVVCFLL